MAHRAAPFADHTHEAVRLNVSSLLVPFRKAGVFWVAHLFRDIIKPAKVSRSIQELHTVACPIEARSIVFHVFGRRK